MWALHAKGTPAKNQRISQHLPCWQTMRTAITLVLGRSLVWRSSESPTEDEYDYVLLRVCEGNCSGTDDASYIQAMAVHDSNSPGSEVQITNIQEPTIYADVERACGQKKVLISAGGKFEVV